MSNPNPKTEHLQTTRKPRARLDNPTVAMRMSGKTKSALERLALSYGYRHGGKPWIAGLLAKIAEGELMVVPSPPPVPEEMTQEDKDWLNADLSRLGEYEPYDFGDVDPYTLGKPVIEGQIVD